VVLRGQKRRLIEIARSTNDLEEAATRMGLPAASIRTLARQPGLSFKRRLPSRTKAQEAIKV
jgi:hypothetical protein